MFFFMNDLEFSKNYLKHQNWLYRKIEKKNNIKLGVGDKYIIRKTINKTIEDLMCETGNKNDVDFGLCFLQINYPYLLEYNFAPY